MKSIAVLMSGVTVFGLAGLAEATTVTAHLNVDDFFQLYVSTDDSALGELVCENNGVWQETITCEIPLTPCVTNYIHVVGEDLHRVIASFIGDFTLSDEDFQFSNGTQELLTNTTDWHVYSDEFGVTLGTLTSQGVNGAGPWGTRPSVNSDAEWIWTDNGYYFDGPLYFSTAISPAACPTPPEHFACYQVRPAGHYDKFQVDSLKDQFLDQENFTIAGPMEICAPADKNEEGVENWEDHLVCYYVYSRETVKPQWVEVENQFGTKKLMVYGKTRKLCVPSAKKHLNNETEMGVTFR